MPPLSRIDLFYYQILILNQENKLFTMFKPKVFIAQKVQFFFEEGEYIVGKKENTGLPAFS